MSTIKRNPYGIQILYIPAHDEPPAGGGSAPQTFTQEQLNTILADEKRKAQGAITQLQAEVEALSKRANLTTKDRSELENRLSELNSQLLTKEELAKQEKDKLLKQHTQEREQLANELKDWRGRYENTRIESALLDAAVKHNAFNPEQIVTILRSNTRMVEVVENEQPTGNYDVRIKLRSKNSKGESVDLDLSPVEAVKHMSEQPDSLNLFKSESSAGYGGRGSNTNKLDPVALAKDPAAYRAARKAGNI